MRSGPRQACGGDTQRGTGRGWASRRWHPKGTGTSFSGTRAEERGGGLGQRISQVCLQRPASCAESGDYASLLDRARPTPHGRGAHGCVPGLQVRPCLLPIVVGTPGQVVAAVPTVFALAAWLVAAEGPDAFVASLSVCARRTPLAFARCCGTQLRRRAVHRASRVLWPV